MFCTTGILLRRLAGDVQLQSVSHVIVDEVGLPLPCEIHCCLELPWQTTAGAPGRSRQAKQFCSEAPQQAGCLAEGVCLNLLGC